MKKCEKPLVSIIVPVYNVAQYLAECLDSLINQTLKEIEIICVEDCSSDNSMDILNSYAMREERLIIIRHPENRGLPVTRRDGVAASTGKYIMFVDSDDSLYLDACECAYKEIENSQADIVQFDTEVINRAGVSSERIRRTQAFVKPYMNPISGNNLLHACWIDKIIGFTIWNKIYKGDICRKAFEMIADTHIVIAEDVYLSFFIMLYGKTYAGLEKKLYKYNYGIGVSGGDTISLKSFEKYLDEKKILENIKRFVHKQNVEQQLQIYVELLQKKFVNDGIHKWYLFLEKKCLREGLQKLISTWGTENLIYVMEENNWYNYDGFTDTLSQILMGENKKQSVRKGRKITAACYWTDKNPEEILQCVQNNKDVLEYCRSAGRKISRWIVFSECDSDDFMKTNRIYCEKLPARRHKDYKKRFEKLEELVKDEQIKILAVEKNSVKDFCSDILFVKSVCADITIVVFDEKNIKKNSDKDSIWSIFLQKKDRSRKGINKKLE